MYQDLGPYFQRSIFEMQCNILYITNASLFNPYLALSNASKLAHDGMSIDSSENLEIHVSKLDILVVSSQA